MSAPLSHSFCGFLFYPDTTKHLFSNRIYAASYIVLFSNFPDYDFLIGLVLGDLLWGHRLFTHTIFFPLVVGLIAGMGGVVLHKKFLPGFTLTAALVGVHILLDYLSFDYEPMNGIGVPLFWPFSTNYYNFPFHPIADYFLTDPSNLSVFLINNELYYMAIFFGFMFVRKRYLRKKGVLYAYRSHERYSRRA